MSLPVNGDIDSSLKTLVVTDVSSKHFCFWTYQLILGVGSRKIGAGGKKSSAISAYKDNSPIRT